MLLQLQLPKKLPERDSVKEWGKSMGKKIQIVDTTMRDGSHAMSHSYSSEQVVEITKGLDAAGLPVIEISHGDGLGGSSLNYGISKVRDITLIEAAAKAAKKSRIGALLIPGIGTIDNLKEAYESGISVVRIATHVTEGNIAIQHIRAAKNMGLFTCGFLMMVHMASAEEILEQAKIFADSGVDYINLADSAGCLTPDDVRFRISHLKEHLDIPVGFHAHNNLGLAMANSIAAVETGADYIDASCRGIGAGAGNCQEEVLAAVLERMGYETGVNLESVMTVAEEVLEPVMMRLPRIDNASLMLGYAGVYSSFLLHANRAAEKFGLKSKDILMELGKRQMVGGQEDMIMDVAYQMFRKSEKNDG